MIEYLTDLYFMGIYKGRSDKAKFWEPHWVDFGPDQGENEWIEIYMVELIKVKLNNGQFECF